MADTLKENSTTEKPAAKKPVKKPATAEPEIITTLSGAYPTGLRRTAEKQFLKEHARTVEKSGGKLGDLTAMKSGAPGNRNWIISAPLYAA